MEVDIILSGAVPKQGMGIAARRFTITVTNLLRVAYAVSIRSGESAGVEIDIISCRAVPKHGVRIIACSCTITITDLLHAACAFSTRLGEFARG